MFSSQILEQLIQKDGTSLCEIMTRNLSDKGNGHHNYTKLYYEMFKHLVDANITMLEIGIGSVNPYIPSNMTGGELGQKYKSGASIRGWLEFFKNPTIFACDIDRAIINFKEPEITGFYFDQTNEQLMQDITTDGLLKDQIFDIIIDDGLHQFDVNCNVMKYLLPKVKSGGYYIIEDIIHSQFNYKYLDFSLLKGKQYWYVRLPNEKNTVDNNLFIVKC